MKKSNFSSIESIIKTVKKNGMYILVDDESKHEEMENEGDLVISTSAVSPKHINFIKGYPKQTKNKRCAHKWGKKSARRPAAAGTPRRPCTGPARARRCA